MNNNMENDAGNGNAGSDNAIAVNFKSIERSIRKLPPKRIAYYKRLADRDIRNLRQFRRIDDRRVGLKISARSLARKAGYSETYYYRCRTGETIPSIGMIENLGEALDSLTSN